MSLQVTETFSGTLKDGMCNVANSLLQGATKTIDYFSSIWE